MAHLAPIWTARLVLRPLREDEQRQVSRILSSPTTMAEVIGGPLTAEAAGAWLAGRLADEARHGYSMWAVEHLGRVVGLCGFFPTPGGELDLAYVVHHEHQGQGIASEAAVAAVRAARAAGHRVLATIRPANLASLAVAETAGLRRTPETLEAKPGLLVFRSD